MELTLKHLKEVVKYDPETGFFIRLNHLGKGPRGNKGDYVGSILRKKNGGIQVVGMIERKNYILSRLAWFYMTGEWPKGQIDHINCDPTDNRWNNLRNSTPPENGRNKRKYKNNGLPKGIRFHRGAYEPQANYNGKQQYLGRYKTLEEAAIVRNKAVKLYYGEFARFD